MIKHNCMCVLFHLYTCIDYLENPNPDTGENVTESNSATSAFAPVAASLGLLLGMTIPVTVAVVALLVIRHMKHKRMEEDRM